MIIEQKAEINRINKPYVFVCGNHESPVSQYDSLTKSFGKLEFDNVKVIYLDDSTHCFNQEQYDYLLEESKDNKPIILVMHEPISTRNNKKQMSRFEKYYVIDYKESDSITKKTIDLIYRNEMFKLILCGHIHGYHKSAFAKNRYQICASSGLIGKVNNIKIK